MTTNIQKELAALRRMGVAELRRRHIELFGEENHSGNRQYLFRRIALSRDDRLPMPGTVLRRVFKGREHHVTILADAFEYDGETYRSLSAIAHAITGAHWNGYHFFGIQKREQA